MMKRWLVATAALALLLLSTGTSSAQVLFGLRGFGGYGAGLYPRYGLGYGYNPLGVGYGGYPGFGAYGTGLYGGAGLSGYGAAYTPGYYGTAGYGLGGYTPYTSGYYSPSYAYSSSYYPRYVAPYDPTVSRPPALYAQTAQLPSRGITSGVSGESERADDRAAVEVMVPADAELWFDGQKTNKTGRSRTFYTPPLERGKSYHYDVEARWTEDDKPVERMRRVHVTAGERVPVDFLREADDADKPGKSEKSEKVDKPTRPSKPDKSDQPDKGDKDDK